ncbi:MAG: C39 family peptidase [Phycisphaeraceae bacterium]
MTKHPDKHDPFEPISLNLSIQRQPDNSTCGPTALQAVYRYYGDPIALNTVIRETDKLAGGGTLAVMLGCHALERGYRAKLYTYNLTMFDPTWFVPTPVTDLAERLKLQARYKATYDPKFQTATDAYLRFLDLGGEIRFEDLSSRLIVSQLRRGHPILVGLSSTYLYRCAREFGPDDEPDDIRGLPMGHFVVVCGYHPTRRQARVADPLHDETLTPGQVYDVPMTRLVAAIMLGVLTYDANMLIIYPHQTRPGETVVHESPPDRR